VNVSESTLFTYNSDNKVTGWKNGGWNGSAWYIAGDQYSNIYNSNNILQSQVVTIIDSDGTVFSGDSTYYYFHHGATEINQLSARQLAGQISVYPNPSSDFIHATIQLNQTTDLQLRLVNMLGQTVWSVDAGTISSYQNNISVANLPDGVYLLEMVTGGGTESKEIIVTH
jgi:hypothetical protein